MLEGKLIIIPALGHWNKENSTSQAWLAFVSMYQCGNNNELALQYGGFCTMWSFVAKGLFGDWMTVSVLLCRDVIIVCYGHISVLFSWWNTNKLTWDLHWRRWINSWCCTEIRYSVNIMNLLTLKAETHDATNRGNTSLRQGFALIWSLRYVAQI